MIECVHNYTSTYAKKQGYNWTKTTGMNMCQIQKKQVKEARWNQQIQTDRTILSNKSDITCITRDNEKGTCMFIDVAISETEM